MLFRTSMAKIRTYCTMGADIFLPDTVEVLATILQTNGWTDAAATLREANRLRDD